MHKWKWAAIFGIIGLSTAWVIYGFFLFIIAFGASYLWSGLGGIVLGFALLSIALLYSFSLIPSIIGNFSPRANLKVTAISAACIAFVIPITHGVWMTSMQKIALAGDKTNYDFLWPDEISFFSYREGQKCAKVCVELLYGGHVKRLFAYRLISTVDHSTGSNWQPGRAYWIEERPVCPDPEKVGVDSWMKEITRAYAAIGRCLISDKAPLNPKGFHIIHDSKKTSRVPIAGQFKKFSRLTIIADGTAPNHHPEKDDILVSKTFVSYLVANVPFLGINFSTVSNGGPRFLIGLQNAHSQYYDRALFMMRLSTPLARAPIDAKRFSDIDRARAKISIPFPDSEQRLAAIMSVLKSSAEERYAAGRPIMDAIRKEAFEAFQRRRKLGPFPSDEKFIEAMYSAALVDVSALKPGDLSLPKHGFYFDQYIQLVFGSTKPEIWKKYRKKIPYLSESKILEFETKALESCIVLNNSIIEQQEYVNHGVISLSQACNNIAASWNSVPEHLFFALYNLTARSSNDLYFEEVLQNNLSQFPEIANIIINGLVESHESSHNGHVNRQLHSLTLSLPTADWQNNADLLVKFAQAKADDYLSPQYVVKLSAFGESVQPLLFRIAENENTRVRKAAYISLCMIGDSINDKFFFKSVSKLKASLNSRHRPVVYPAIIRMFQRTARISEFKRIIVNQKHEFDETAINRINLELQRAKITSAEDCDSSIR